MFRTDELEYELPPERIATRPASPRDSARLLVMRGAGASLLDRVVRELPGLLPPRALLVVNTTAVVPARVLGVRADTGAEIEGLCLTPPGEPARLWRVLLRARRLRAGVELVLRGGGGEVRATVRSERADDEGAWTIELAGLDGISTGEVLTRIGTTPLPPYILRSRRERGEAGDERADRAAYQTVYADRAGSVAAPTAGLHFTPAMLAALGAAGIERAEVVLHVGPGTFRPVSASHVEEHGMHAEPWSIPWATVSRIVRARSEGRPVIAVGTTSARALEACAMEEEARPGREGIDRSGVTRLLIAPGHRWRWTDGLLTNFHLPRSTLLAMVMAIAPGGAAAVRHAYAHAIERGYRFYSYGDAMLILR